MQPRESTLQVNLPNLQDAILLKARRLEKALLGVATHGAYARAALRKVNWRPRFEENRKAWKIINSLPDGDDYLLALVEKIPLADQLDWISTYESEVPSGDYSLPIPGGIQERGSVYAAAWLLSELGQLRFFFKSYLHFAESLGAQYEN